MPAKRPMYPDTQSRTSSGAENAPLRSDASDGFPATRLARRDTDEALTAALAGRYAIQREIGRGGMASVYLAYDERNHRQVAIKVLHPELASGLGTERFLREIFIAARLQHPHIVPLYDSGEAAGLLYYVMPFIEGMSLRDRIDRERQLPLHAAIAILRDVANALDYAHAHGVVHRDVKPGNILICGPNATVADFGVARAIEAAGGQSLTSSGIALGTPAYMSPEQAAGETALDGRSDVYALGCVAYEMLAGEPPFTGSTPQAVVAKHMQAPVPKLRFVRSIVSAELERVLETALAKVPADRYASAGAFAQAFELAATNAGAPKDKRWHITFISGLALSALLILFGERAGLRSDRDNAPGVAIDRPRIAVLYFDDQSSDASLGLVADGLTEELIHELSGVNAFQVVSRNGVKQYRGRQVPFDSIVNRLRVTTVIDGSVQAVARGLRVVVHLIDARTNTSVDLLTLERPLGDFIALERDVAREVAAALRKRMGRAVRLRGAILGSTSQPAREFVLRAQRARDDAERLGDQAHPEDVRTAVSVLARADTMLIHAMNADPDWLRPLIERGWTAHQRSRLQSGAARARALEQALGYANEAVQRDPNSAAALELRGALQWQLVTELEAAPSDPERMQRAETDLRAALDRDSTLAMAWATLSYLLSVKGSFGEAAIAAENALRHDPYLEGARDVFVQLFYGALMLEDFGQARDWCLRGRLSTPNDWRFVECELTLMRHDARVAADPERAWALVTELERLDPAEKGRAAGRAYNVIYRRIVAATISARAGHHGIARAELARAIRATQRDRSLRLDLAYDEAYLRLVLGERDRSIDLLRELVTARPVLRAQLSRDPLFRDLSLVP